MVHRQVHVCGVVKNVCSIKVLVEKKFNLSQTDRPVSSSHFSNKLWYLTRVMTWSRVAMQYNSVCLERSTQKNFTPDCVIFNQY